MVDNPLFVAGIAVVTSIIASSGFWAFIQRKDSKKNARTQLLVGLAHEQIAYLAWKYVDRGWMTQNEYDILRLLYTSYTDLGGNGLIQRVMQDVEALPIRKFLPKEKNDDGPTT